MLFLQLGDSLYGNFIAFLALYLPVPCRLSVVLLDITLRVPIDDGFILPVELLVVIMQEHLEAVIEDLIRDILFDLELVLHLVHHDFIIDAVGLRDRHRSRD